MQSATNVDELNVSYIQQQLAEGNKARALQLAKQYTVQNSYDPKGWLVLGTIHRSYITSEMHGLRTSVDVRFF